VGVVRENSAKIPPGPAHGHICPKCKLPKQGSSFAGVLHSFAGMVQNVDTTWNNIQITHWLDVTSIFLDLNLRDFPFRIRNNK
jgi:hypothetical protein